MSYLSNEEIAFATGHFYSGHWLTFNHERMIVHREPKKTISNVNTSSYYGYDKNKSVSDNITLIPQSSVFPCIVRHKTDKQENQFIPESMIRVIDGDLRIKIETDAKNYIEAETIKSIELDGQFFNLNSEPFSQNFLGLRFYYYDLGKVK